MNRHAFTLIEVLVSVAILSVVATGLFQISLNSKNNYEFLEHKVHFDRLCSIPIMHSNPKYHHKEKTLYEFLRSDYNIKEDQVRQFLKQKKIQYTQEKYTTFSPLTEGIEKEELDDNSLGKSMSTDLILEFDKIIISNKSQSTYIYQLKKSQ